jgi:CheY-like chemotaxis protein
MFAVGNEEELATDNAERNVEARMTNIAPRHSTIRHFDVSVVKRPRRSVMHRLRLVWSWLSLAGLLAVCVVATAQVAEPAADVPAQIETNPAVLSALELPRTKPGDYLQVVVCLVDLGQPELAAPIFKELRALRLTDAQRAALVHDYGSHRMLQIARTPELPNGAAFAESCLAAAAAEARDPQRLAKLIDALADPSHETRLLALADLTTAGQDGATALLEALARERNPERRGTLADAAVAMHPLVVGPLVAILETRDADLRAEVIRLLDQLDVSQVAPLLAADAAHDPATSASAERALVDAIHRYERGAKPFASDGANQIELWQWDDAAGTLNSARYPADDARTIWTARLALRLAQLAPHNRAYQRQALVCGLEAAALQAGGSTESRPQPPATPLRGAGSDQLKSQLEAADVAMLNDVLADALKQGYANAAVAAADLIARQADASALATSDGRPSPLADALVDSHRRVRFAALRAIMTLDPAKPFPGSSRVPEALGYFAGSTGQRRAVAAMPTMVRATTLAGQLAAAGIDAEAADNGNAAVHAAIGMTDLEMILVDMNIARPGVREVVYQLRAAPATGRVPIALLASDGERLASAQRLAGEHSQAIAAPRPTSEEALKAIVDRLGSLAERDATTVGERADQAAQAMTWLARLLTSDRSFYRLGRQSPVIEASLYQLDASQAVLAALVALGTPTSQRTLADYASQATVPIDARQRAADAFRTSVDQHGLLLAPDEILRQYDRYNASAGADAATQQVLGSLLDAIESHRSTPPLPLGEGRGEGVLSPHAPGTDRGAEQ